MITLLLLYAQGVLTRLLGHIVIAGLFARLRSKTGQYVCLQSRGILEFNKSSKKIDHFVCINTKIRYSMSEKSCPILNSEYSI